MLAVCLCATSPAQAATDTITQQEIPPLCPRIVAYRYEDSYTLHVLSLTAKIMRLVHVTLASKVSTITFPFINKQYE